RRATRLSLWITPPSQPCVEQARTRPNEHRTQGTKPQEAYRFAARARALAASISRFFGGAEVDSDSSSVLVAAATASTASAKACAFAAEGLVVPATLRTYCSAAACTSSAVAGGSKLWSGRMLRHMNPP